MKLSIESGTVVCSLENKNSEFLGACAGLFDGFLKGKLKMYWESSEGWVDPDSATEWNAQTLEEILRIARRYGVEIDESVERFNSELQVSVKQIKDRREAEKQAQAQREKWERMCRNGCGGCKNLAYDIDLPICKQTGAVLEEKNVEKYKGGVLHLFNLEPFPSEECPFNIIKKQGATNERLPKTCLSKAEA